eukprot:517771-Pelagomonas_calceolata.AAC.1
MQACKLGPIESLVKDLKSARGYHPNTFTLCVVNACHVCSGDFWEEKGRWSMRVGAVQNSLQPVGSMSTCGLVGCMSE